ncbi:hypothetical protein PR048_027147 [Dryococelus australis]|uniref:Uncharacterized protein n=1 Tax=Dryococelus australis TaxID=614101 RepID=A0ABQ9GEL6_9NEOP|nr:hypothetical protein PR048_027147 [Dryococelus australis]
MLRLGSSTSQVCRRFPQGVACSSSSVIPSLARTSTSLRGSSNHADTDEDETGINIQSRSPSRVMRMQNGSHVALGCVFYSTHTHHHGARPDDRHPAWFTIRTSVEPRTEESSTVADDCQRPPSRCVAVDDKSAASVINMPAMSVRPSWVAANILVLAGCPMADVPKQPPPPPPREHESIEPGSPWWEASELTARPPRPRPAEVLLPGYSSASCKLSLTESRKAPPEAEKRGSNKGDKAKRIKCPVTPMSKALNWRVVFSLFCVYLWDFNLELSSAQISIIVSLVSYKYILKYRSVKNQLLAMLEVLVFLMCIDIYMECYSFGWIVYSFFLWAPGVKWLDYLPPAKANRVRSPRFSHVGIVPDDVADWRVFSGISRFPRPLHFGAAPHLSRFAFIGCQDLDVKGDSYLSTLLFFANITQCRRRKRRSCRVLRQSVITAFKNTVLKPGKVKVGRVWSSAGMQWRFAAPSYVTIPKCEKSGSDNVVNLTPGSPWWEANTLTSAAQQSQPRREDTSYAVPVLWLAGATARRQAIACSCAPRTLLHAVCQDQSPRSAARDKKLFGRSLSRSAAQHGDCARVDNNSVGGIYNSPSLEVYDPGSCKPKIKACVGFSHSVASSIIIGSPL